MSICLSHESALRYWLTKTGSECVPDCSGRRSLAWARASMREIKEAPLPIGYSEESPLHVLVPNDVEKRGLKSVVTHVCAHDLPEGSLYELAGANCVCSPELTFVQMASRRRVGQMVELGCHLCSSFAVSDAGRGYAGRRDALTTPERIGELLGSLSRVHGLVVARQALRYVVPCTASPMEILLAMAFALPARLGGWAMPRVVANQRIDVDERYRPLVGKGHFRGDLYLPSVRGNVEYDSYEYHTGKFRYDHTQARRNVLEAMGIKTMSATWGQLDTFDKFETFIGMVKRRFGIVRQDFTDDERAEQMSLYAHLTDREARLF